jgi:hypothetical protein
VKVI